MPRKRRVWLPYSYHHVYNRGHNRENIFHDEIDMAATLRILEAIHTQHSISISAYCIMTNHYHLLLKTEKTPLSTIIKHFQKQYADYYNKRYHRSGSVFDKRFNSKAFPYPKDLLTVSRYIHRNPVRTKIPMVDRMEQYPYGSYQYYKQTRNPFHSFINLTDVPTSFPLIYQQNHTHYCQYVEEGEESIEENFLD